MHPSTATPTPSPESARWFADEVHPHEPQVRDYLYGSFPGIRDVDYVGQESFLRIWKARTGGPIQFGKAFLFIVARNLALSLIQRQRWSPIDAVTDLAALRIIVDRQRAVEAACTREEIELLAVGIKCCADATSFCAWLG